MSENRGKGEVWRKKEVGMHLLKGGIGLRGGRE